MKSSSDPESVFPRPVLLEKRIEIPLPREVVFNFMADIERLPRWAPGFCECVYLARGRWMGLTSLGEMFLAMESDANTGRIALRAGWEIPAGMTFEIRIESISEDATRIFLVHGKTRLHEALDTDFSLLAECIACDSGLPFVQIV